MTEFDERRARFAEKELAKETESRKGEVKIGEVTGTVTGDIARSSGGAKIRIDHAGDMNFSPEVNLGRGDTIKVSIMADWSKRGQKKETVLHQAQAKGGEAMGEVTGNIKTNDNVKIRIDRVEGMSFKPSAELKKGDTIRVIITKV